MPSEKTLLYIETMTSIRDTLLIHREEKTTPENYIVATHGPALTKALKENPELLNLIGIYRVNCSHLGKESDLKSLAEYLKTLHPFVPILIDLQGPKPRIHELDATLNNTLSINLGEYLSVEYQPSSSPEKFCTKGKLKVCFPEIVEIMEVGDKVVFDDAKMTATVREKNGSIAIIECTNILSGKNTFSLRGRTGICVRNRPLGIECITDHDRKSIEFARDMLGFEYVDNIMVSYFSTLSDIEHFVSIMRDEYGYTGNLGGKFETPHAVYNIDEILASKHLTLAMFGRGDLRVEMDPRAVTNMHDIQTHFFASCKKYGVESICATGFLESMLIPEGRVTPEEIYDMETSMATGPNHLMLSGESTYGAQAKNCIETESKYQRDTYEKIQKNEIPYYPTTESSLRELLYIA